MFHFHINILLHVSEQHHLITDKYSINEQNIEQFLAVSCNEILKSFHKLSNATKSHFVNVNSLSTTKLFCLFWGDLIWTCACGDKTQSFCYVVSLFCFQICKIRQYYLTFSEAKWKCLLTFSLAWEEEVFSHENISVGKQRVPPWKCACE